MEGSMGSKILGFCVLLVVCVGLYFAYDHYRQQKQMDSGEVTWESGQPTPAEKAAYDKEDHGETADGQSEHKQHTAAQDAAAIANGQSDIGPAAKTAAPAAGAATTSASVAAPTAPVTAPAPAAAQPAMPSGSYSLGTGAPPASLPTRDTLPPNAPNELHFSGSGTYQWYRQGNLTYRVDTVSGRSCIAYATLEEWRKQIVYSNGCGRGA
jgi:hypothetical protein